MRASSRAEASNLSGERDKPAFERELFSGNGYNRLMSSPGINITQSMAGIIPITLSLSCFVLGGRRT